MRQFYQELRGQRTLGGNVVWANGLLLEHVGCVDYLPILFDKQDFVAQYVNVLVQQLDQKGCAVEVSDVALTQTFDLGPSGVLAVEQLLVR